MSTATKKDHKSNRPERGGTVTFVEAIRQGIWEEMESDPAVFCIGEDVGAYGGAFKVTDGLLDEFGAALNAEAFFQNTAGLKMVEPSTAYDAKGLIKAAIRDPDPVLYFEHKKLYRLPRLRAEIPEDDYVVEIGKAKVVKEGRDLSIITFGAQVLNALDAAEELEREGLDVEVVDLRTLAPMDKDAILASAKKTSRVLILHEASRTGGIGGEIAATISEEAFEWLDAPVVRLAATDTPVPYSPPLEEYHLPQVRDVLAASRRLAAY
ncbi:MAG: hypothetical protein LC785_17570 [Acidobacteria bacterium]|nr:hypothetical protein [Acidobacteriota bacterium]